MGVILNYNDRCVEIQGKKIDVFLFSINRWIKCDCLQLFWLDIDSLLAVDWLINVIKVFWGTESKFHLFSLYF